MELFGIGKLLKQWNHMLISLVPKKSHVANVEEYRFISCCIVFYKVVSKIIARKLAEVVWELFHLAQATFVKGRSIVDTIHLT